MSDVIKKSEELIKEADTYLKTGKDLVQTFIKLYAKEIIRCENENDFFNLVAKVADDLYKGNIVIEMIDEFAAKRILKVIDKMILDKFFGENWFIKLRIFATNHAE